MEKALVLKKETGPVAIGRIVPNCKSNPSCKICKSVLINRLVTNPQSWSLPEWRVQFAYLILHLHFSDGKLVIMVQVCPAALLVNECDLPVAHGPQWNFNHPRALVKIYQADCGVDVVQPWCCISAWVCLYSMGNIIFQPSKIQDVTVGMESQLGCFWCNILTSQDVYLLNNVCCLLGLKYHASLYCKRLRSPFQNSKTWLSTEEGWHKMYFT